MATPANPLENMVTTLIEAPGRFNRFTSQFVDACTCGRTDKAAVNAIKAELEAKDNAIERLEEEIRRKDSEKDNLLEMQKDLQAQILQIRAALDAQADFSDAHTKAAGLMQRRARGQKARREFEERRARNELPGQARLEAKQQEGAALRMQTRFRGKSARRLVGERFPQYQPPARAAQPYADVDIGSAGTQGYGDEETPARQVRGGYEGDEGAYSEMGGSVVPSTMGGGESIYDDESVDSDYDYDDGAFVGLGLELLAGKLKLAKVYGREEPPAAEDELEWEVRYFVLFDSGRICHFDDLQDGLPVGDRGLIDLANITSVEKVLGVSTFVMKGENKVYMFKIEPHDEVMMRTWIAAISQELTR